MLLPIKINFFTNILAVLNALLEKSAYRRLPISQTFCGSDGHNFHLVFDLSSCNINGLSSAEIVSQGLNRIPLNVVIKYFKMTDVSAGKTL